MPRDPGVERVATDVLAMAKEWLHDEHQVAATKGAAETFALVSALRSEVARLRGELDYQTKLTEEHRQEAREVARLREREGNSAIGWVVVEHFKPEGLSTHVSLPDGELRSRSDAEAIRRECEHEARHFSDCRYTVEPVGGAASGGWRDIETAPRDETHILAWFHDDAPERRHWGEHQSGVSIAYWTDHNGGGWVSNRLGEPTHWQPLPPAPPSEPTPVPAETEEATDD